MRVVVIGGTQFMGREIVRRLAADRHEVWVLHRRDHHELGPDVRNFQADRADVALVGRLLRDHDIEVVYDLAYDWQLGTTAAQVEAVARACGGRLHRYVFMSSIAAYGAGLGHVESDPLAADDVPVPYVQHKAMAERALFRLHAEHGLPVVTFRPPFVHGPRQPFYREQFFWDRLHDGRPIILPDGGDTPMQWAYVGDVADACLQALDVPGAVGEAFNIGHVDPIPQRAFVEALASVAGLTATLVPVPRADILAAGGRLAGGPLYFGEYLDLPPITEVVEKVTRVLGVEPLSLAEGLRRGYEWYRTEPRRQIDYAFEDSVLVGSV